jgi:hypothetical protein
MIGVRGLIEKVVRNVKQLAKIFETLRILLNELVNRHLLCSCALHQLESVFIGSCIEENMLWAQLASEVSRIGICLHQFHGMPDMQVSIDVRQCGSDIQLLHHLFLSAGYIFVPDGPLMHSFNVIIFDKCIPCEPLKEESAQTVHRPRPWN